MAEDTLGALAMKDQPVRVHEAGTPVAVFLSDTAIRDDWVAIPLHADTLYVHPRAVFRRCNIVGVQSGAIEHGHGLLALELSSAASAAIAALTVQHPGKRLALVVGRTLIAAQTYLAPFMGRYLAFHVGSRHDAAVLAQAVAGCNETLPARLAADTPAPREAALATAAAQWRYSPISLNRSGHPGSQALRS